MPADRRLIKFGAPGSEHTVLLSQLVNHILLLAVDPASRNER